MNRNRAFLFCCAAIVCHAQVPSAAFEKLVTASHIQKITKVKTPELMWNPPLNDSLLATLNVFKDGSPLLMVNFAKPGTFKMDKAHAVAGLGDEAFESADHLSLCFRKGNRPVMITSGFDLGAGLKAPKPLWTPEQLKVLAEIIASRM